MSQKVRIENFKRIAYDLKGKFIGDDEYGLNKLLGDFRLMSIGTNRKIRNQIKITTDKHSDEIRIFDYYFTVSTGNSHVRYKQSCIFFRSHSLCLPHFLLRKEHLGDKIMSLLGVKDINFSNHPDFSRLYYLKGKDKDYIHAYFDHQKIIEFIMNRKYQSGMEGINYFLLIHSNKKLMKTNQIKHWYQENQKFYELSKQRCMVLFPSNDIRATDSTNNSTSPQ